MRGLDKKGQDRTRQDKTGQDRTGQDRTGQDKTRQDKTRCAELAMTRYIKRGDGSCLQQRREKERCNEK